MSDAWQQRSLPDILAPGLRVVFVGVNPGRRSAERGHHFAGPGNHFWRLLYDAGLTDRLLRPDQDGDLICYGYGLTNIVGRPSRSEAELEGDDFRRGAAELRSKLERFRPGLVVLLGKQVYRAYAGLASGAGVAWGLQDTCMMPGLPALVAPNPSARSTVPYSERLLWFRAIRSSAGPAYGC